MSTRMSEWERNDILRSVEQAKKELYNASYLAECADNPGIRAIYSKKADMLNNLIYCTEEYVKIRFAERL